MSEGEPGTIRDQLLALSEEDRRAVRTRIDAFMGANEHTAYRLAALLRRMKNHHNKNKKTALHPYNWSNIRTIINGRPVWVTSTTDNTIGAFARRDTKRLNDQTLAELVLFFCDAYALDEPLQNDKVVNEYLSEFDFPEMMTAARSEDTFKHFLRTTITEQRTLGINRALAFNFANKPEHVDEICTYLFPPDAPVVDEDVQSDYSCYRFALAQDGVNYVQKSRIEITRKMSPDNEADASLPVFSTQTVALDGSELDVFGHVLRMRNAAFLLGYTRGYEGISLLGLPTNNLTTGYKRSLSGLLLTIDTMGVLEPIAGRALLMNDDEEQRVFKEEGVPVLDAGPHPVENIPAAILARIDNYISPTVQSVIDGQDGGRPVNWSSVIEYFDRLLEDAEPGTWPFVNDAGEAIIPIDNEYFRFHTAMKTNR